MADRMNLYYSLLYVCCVITVVAADTKQQNPNPGSRQAVPAVEPEVSQGDRNNDRPQAVRGRNNVGGGSVVSQPLKIADHPDCKDDVYKYCRKSSANNFAVLECLQNDLQEDETISLSCQHLLWQYKTNFTKDPRYGAAAWSICHEEINKFAECSEDKIGKGFLVSCLVKYVDTQIDNKNCREFLRRMKSIVFGDYQYIDKFIDKCHTDILKFKCGRMENEDEDDERKPHNQGRTVSCLAENADKIDPGCRQQLVRVAELQADDYHNDRQLYFACRDDRDRICPNVQSGNGEVYRCLYRHKFDPQMSNQCRKQLANRQKLQHEDYKVNQRLFVSCRQDIEKNQCEGTGNDLHMVKMSKILLCLEEVVRKDDGAQLAPECVAELKEVRRGLLEDYEISPEIAGTCEQEIATQCQKVGARNVIHCLMDLARKPPSRSTSNTESRMSNDCRHELETLLKEADIDEDYSVDPVLQDVCGPIVRDHCQNVRDGEGRVYGCLMSLVGKPGIMTEDCKEKLMEIQYFVSRDFRLSVPFVKKCTKEMSKGNCKPDGTEEIQDQSGMLMCLYREMKSNKAFDPQCKLEIKRLMAERAKSVDLEPDVEQNCMSDLGQFCSAKTGKNEEMDCLEDNIEELQPKCKKAVEAYTERADDLPELNQIFAEACQEFWKENCKEALDSGKEDGNMDSLMVCLIKNKNHPDMNPKCRAGIEHHQLITMKNFRLSRAFRDACKDDVAKCGDINKKSELVECLSSLVHEDTLRDQTMRVSQSCRSQLVFELLQRSEDIVLDPTLNEECRSDVAKYCSNVSPGQSAVINCLRSHQSSLKPRCHQLVFKREKEEAEDPTTDFNLMTKCKRMIKKYCLEAVNTPNKRDTLISCLVEHKEEEEEFDDKCARVLQQRLRVRSHDIRLNPDLMRDCKKDIKDHCRSEMQNASNSQSETEGRVLFCLRKQFAMKKLTESCTSHVSMLIKESILDYVQDVKLAKACGEEIRLLCTDAVEAEKTAENSGHGEVLECLRQKLLIKANAPNINPGCITEVIRSLSENKADVHLDPLLYRACALDLKGFCSGIPRGDGRQMSCLLSALNDKSVKLQKDCQKQLHDRVELWDAAAKMAPPDSMGELISQVYDSEARTYLLTILTVIVLFIFVGGLCCGRVTKRVIRQVKDK